MLLGKKTPEEDVGGVDLYPLRRQIQVLNLVAMNVISFESGLHGCCEVKRGHRTRVCYKNRKTWVLTPRKGAGGDRIRDGLA